MLLRRITAAGSLFALVGLAASAPPAGAQAVAKKVVTSAADLPSFTYPIGDVLPSALVDADAATFNPLATQVRANIESVLAQYDIQDRAALRGLLEQKLELQLLSGTEDAAALVTADQIHALEDKPDAKLLSGSVDARDRRGARQGRRDVGAGLSGGVSSAVRRGTRTAAVVRGRNHAQRDQDHVRSRSRRRC